MTTLYRTPNIVIDRHEWHAVVWMRRGHVSLSYRWRPLSARTYRWLSIESWQGRRPKGLWKFFASYRKHIAFAMECEARRRDAVAKMRPQFAPVAFVPAAPAHAA